MFVHSCLLRQFHSSLKQDKIISLFFLKSSGENKLKVKSVIFLSASIKSMNPMQKYPHITELFARTQKMFVFMFLFPLNSLISLETFSTLKLSKKAISCLLQNKEIQCVPTSIHSSRFITHAPFFLGKLFLEKILVHSHNTSVFKNLVKNEAELKMPIFSSYSFYNSFSCFFSRTSCNNSFSC